MKKITAIRTRRNQFECRKEFEVWINIANLCPKDNLLPEIIGEKINWLFLSNFSGTLNESSFISWMRRNELDEKLIKHCIDNKDTKLIWNYLQEVFDIAKTLRESARYGENPKKASYEQSIRNILLNIPITYLKNPFPSEFSQSTNFRLPLTFCSGIYIQKDTYYLKPEQSEFIRLLINEFIDVRNIKLCENCEDIFWRKRIEQIYCSKRCRNYLNTKKHRRKKESEEPIE